MFAFDDAGPETPFAFLLAPSEAGHRTARQVTGKEDGEDGAGRPEKEKRDPSREFQRGPEVG